MATKHNNEFDSIAEHYQDLHQRAIGLSGETTSFFAEYKVRDAVALIRRLGLADSITVLDFGSGIGESIPYFHRYLPGCRLMGLDVSGKSLKLAQNNHVGLASLACYDGSSIPCRNDSVDVVFTACVFHHIVPVQRVEILLEIRRVLKPSGLFIAFEHNPHNPLTVRAVNSCPFDENAVLLKGREFLQLLRQAGFADVVLKYRIFFPAVLKFLRPLERLLTWLPLGAQYFVCGIAERK